MSGPEQTQVFDTGAVRSKQAHLDWTSLHPIGLMAVARTAAEGREKYGASNYEKGMPVTTFLNHALTHIFAFLGGDRSAPHLEHAAWNLLGAITSYVLWPHLNQDLRVAGRIPPAVVEYLDTHEIELRAKREAGGPYELGGAWTTAEIPEVKAMLGS